MPRDKICDIQVGGCRLGSLVLVLYGFIGTRESGLDIRPTSWMKMQQEMGMLILSTDSARMAEDGVRCSKLGIERRLQLSMSLLLVNLGFSE